MEEDDEFLPISALQHLAFCPRQWGLIHLEQCWAENRLTAEGKQLHERVDLPGQNRREQVRSVRGMWLRSERLRVFGRADLVEFSPDPAPVEYKRGRRKPDDCDAVQLCAQAFCLEEMMNAFIPKGAFFYGEPRRRVELPFTPELRARTIALCAEMHALYEARITPPPRPGPHCRSCSLVHVCLPGQTGESEAAAAWLGQHLEEMDREPMEDDVF